MHQNLQDLLDKRFRGASQSVVNPKVTTLGGTLSTNQLEELIHITQAHNARLELVAGVLTVTTN